MQKFLVPRLVDVSLIVDVAGVEKMLHVRLKQPETGEGLWQHLKLGHVAGGQGPFGVGGGVANHADPDYGRSFSAPGEVHWHEQVIMQDFWFSQVFYTVEVPGQPSLDVAHVIVLFYGRIPEQVPPLPIKKLPPPEIAVFQVFVNLITNVFLKNQNFFGPLEKIFYLGIGNSTFCLASLQVAQNLP